MAQFLEKFLTGDKSTNSRTKYEVLCTGILLITAQAAIQSHTAPKVYQYSAYFSKLDETPNLSQNTQDSNLTCPSSSENHIDAKTIQSMNMVNTFMGPIVGFFACILVDQLDVIIFSQLCGWFFTIGTIIKLAGFYLRIFKLSLFGQFITTFGIGINFVPSKISNEWFTEKERGLITAVLVAGNSLGTVFVFSFASLPVSLEVYTVVACFLAVLSGPASSYFLKNYPRFKNNEKPAHVAKFSDWMKVFKIPQMYPLFLGISSAIGMAISLIFIFRMLFCPKGYTPTELNAGIIVMLTSSAIGFIIWGILSDKTKRPDLLAKASFLVQLPLGVFTLKYFVAWERNASLMFFLLALQGLSGSSFALIYQCGFETAFGKVGAGMTGGILWMVGNFASFVFVMFTFKMSEQVESKDPSSCLDFAPCQTKEWNLSGGIGNLLYLYITFVMVFLVVYRCDFKWSNFKKAENDKNDEINENEVEIPMALNSKDLNL